MRNKQRCCKSRGDDEDQIEKFEKYIKSAHVGDHADVVLPHPVWIQHSEDSEFLIGNCHAPGAKKCSTFEGDKALMDSIEDA